MRMASIKIYLLFSLLLLSIGLMAYSLFKTVLFLDSLVVAVFFISVYHFDRKYGLPTSSFLLLMLAICLHTIGVLGLYSKFVFWILSFDKIVHFVSGFAVVYFILNLNAKKKSFFSYLFAILIMMGAGAIVELNEFVGARYFGIHNVGIFTQGDSLEIKSDLQRYDTYYDMVFNLAGALASSFSHFFLRKQKYKKRTFSPA